MSKRINVSSAAHTMSGKPDLNVIQLKKNYSFGNAYGQSKLYLIWITQHLTTELKEKELSNIKSLRVPPALQAGLIKGLMSIEDIVNLVLAEVPKKGGSYKKNNNVGK